MYSINCSKANDAIVMLSPATPSHTESATVSQSVTNTKAEGTKSNWVALEPQPSRTKAGKLTMCHLVSRLVKRKMTFDKGERTTRWQSLLVMNKSVHIWGCGQNYLKELRIYNLNKSFTRTHSLIIYFILILLLYVCITLANNSSRYNYALVCLFVCVCVYLFVLRTLNLEKQTATCVWCGIFKKLCKYMYSLND